MKKLQHGKAGGAAGLTAVLAGWAAGTVWADGLSTLPPVATQTNVTYASDIRPILAAHCFPCHGEDLQKRRLRLDSRESVLKGCEDGPVIFPGKSDRGDLILEICGLGDHDMPPWPAAPPLFSREHYTNAPAFGPDGVPAQKPLTAGEIGLIRAWVDQGAK
jgi:hypothetical protein